MAGRQTTQHQSGQEEEREPVPTPYHVYDVFGYETLSHLESLRAFLVYFIAKEGDKELAERLKTARLELKPTRHVKQGLRPGYSDLWVEATFDGEPQRKLRIQVEMKRETDSGAPLQVWLNQLEDAKQELGSGEAEAGSLTERISLVFILGSGRRSGRMSIREMFDGEGQRYLKDRRMQGGRIFVADLMKCELEELVALPCRRLSVRLSAVRCAIEPERYGEEGLVRALWRVDLYNKDEIITLVLVLLRLYPKCWHGMVRRVLEKVGIGGEIMDSIYDDAVLTGWAEGKAEGVAIGKAEMFLAFAQRKFKQVPDEWAEQVRSAAPEQLDDWLLRAYDTDDLASVFNGSAVSGHVPAQKKSNGSP